MLDWNRLDQDGAAVLRAMRKDGPAPPRRRVVSGQPREAIACDLEEMAAAFVSKYELDAARFRSAIASSIQLQEMWPQGGGRTGRERLDS